MEVTVIYFLFQKYTIFPLQIFAAITFFCIHYLGTIIMWKRLWQRLTVRSGEGHLLVLQLAGVFITKMAILFIRHFNDLCCTFFFLFTRRKAQVVLTNVLHAIYLCTLNYVTTYWSLAPFFFFSYSGRKSILVDSYSCLSTSMSAVP